jgi:transposase
MNLQRQKVSENTFAGQPIYVGIDAHLRQWRVSVMTSEVFYKTFSQQPSAEKLDEYLRQNFPGATYLSAYEVGFCGFSIHRELTKLGINSIVVNPGDIPTKDKERCQKEDARDSRKIAHTLRSGELKGIYVPSEKNQQDRQFLRIREKIVKDLKRNKNRVKMLLYFNGIRYPDRFENRGHWSKKFIEWLEGLEFSYETGKWELQAHLDMVKHQRSLLLKVTRQIRELSRRPEYKDDVELLRSVPGIGLLTAMKILTELERIDRFEDFDNLCSYVGLVPSTRSSGERQIDRGITPRTNPHLRWSMIESAWVAIRSDTALLAHYQQLTRRMDGNKAIVRIAKKLLRRMVHVLREREPYMKGIIR